MNGEMSVTMATTQWRGLGRMKTTTLAIVLIGVIAALAGAKNAHADELADRGCITTNAVLGPTGSGACPEVVTRSRLPWLFRFIALSPDGKSLYTAGEEGIARFDRDPTTGALTYRGCITGDQHFGPSTAGCAAIQTATSNGSGSGLDRPVGLTTSPDGKSVYVVATKDTAVARFTRNPSNGALAYRGCITGDKAVGPSGTGSCSQIPSATAGGGGREGGMYSGLSNMTGLAVSPDGNSLYAISDVILNGEGDAAVARFDRNASGALNYRDCISGNKALGPSGSGACTLIPSARTWAFASGLSPVSVALSPDGKSLYTVSEAASDVTPRAIEGSNALASFTRNPSTGALTYRGCITGDTHSGPSGSGACKQIRGATKHGYDSGLPTISLAASPDGQALYAGGLTQVAWLERNPTTGALSYGGCIAGDNGLAAPPAPGVCRQVAKPEGLGLSGQALAVSPDGKTLYAGHDWTLARLERDPANAGLAFRDCTTSDSLLGPSGSGACAAIPSASKSGQGSGFAVNAIAPSQDGESLYTAGEGIVGNTPGSLLTRFGFAPQTRISRATVRRHLASFSFRAEEPSTFECKLKGKRVKPRLRHWRHCGASALRYDGKVRYLHLHSGRRTLRVRATDAIGNTDPTPAKRRWRVR